MHFFDINPNHLPHDGQYYFNVLVITIALNLETWQEAIEDISIEGLESIWYTDQLTSPRPTAIHVYYEEELDGEEGCDFEITAYEHKVVEISSNGIAWYDMIDWDTDDPWDFDGYIEEEET